MPSDRLDLDPNIRKEEVIQTPSKKTNKHATRCDNVLIINPDFFWWRRDASELSWCTGWQLRSTWNYAAHASPGPPDMDTHRSLNTHLKTLKRQGLQIAIASLPHRSQIAHRLQPGCEGRMESELGNLLGLLYLLVLLQSVCHAGLALFADTITQLKLSLSEGRQRSHDWGWAPCPIQFTGRSHPGVKEMMVRHTNSHQEPIL